MLGYIGHGPVAATDGDTSLDVVNAVRNLRTISRATQKIGWWFNRESDYLLAADGMSGEVAIPSNALSTVPAQQHYALDLVERGSRLYSRAKHSFNVGEDIKATIIFGLPFEQLPECVRQYITARAGRVLKSETENQDIPPGTEESMAWLEIRKKDLEADPQNMLSGPQGGPRWDPSGSLLYG